MHAYLNKLINIEIIVLVIDSLHISNHKAAKCHDLLNPQKAHEAIGPGCNLMVAEQTFAWLSK